VKNTLGLFFLYYLRFFAKLQFAKIKLISPKLKVVGITGSAGKTSCLLACKAILSPQFKVKTNYGGNSESGIPLSILNLKIEDYSIKNWLKIFFIAPLKIIFDWKTYQVFLVEMGIDSPTSPKNMDYLLSILKPDIGIFLNVSPVHQQNFKSLDQIAFEKAKMINASKIGIINQNDPLIPKYCHPKKLVSISHHQILLPSFALPRAFQTTLNAALTLANFFDIDQSQSIKNLQANFSLPPSRSSLIKGINESIIIDSSYNSSPIACSEMLNLLNTYHSPKVAILGDMREIGKTSAQEHQKIYRQAIKIADIIISVGPQTKKYFGPKSIKFDYWWQATDYLLKNFPKKSTILVKGSQNTIFLEELVKKILNNPSDSEKLCRQSPYWIKVKEQFRKSI
jgi:UDP-N-acetylmuramoyl-tripeptide--D-alanyl-D-alanine ligase